MLTAQRIFRIFLPARLKRQHYLRILRGAKTHPDLLRCRQYISEGDCVLDIGANIGIYTKPLSTWVGSSGQVHAFEPIPETFGYLANSMEQMGLRNVICHNEGVSSVSRAARMKVPDGNFYQAQLSEQGQEVKLVRLDDLFSSGISFIKCDVEGHELEVIEGAKGLIKACRPTWLMEVSHRETPDRMRNYGYQATKLQQDWLFVAD
jgi:FkbM family methyltransferase